MRKRIARMGVKFDHILQVYNLKTSYENLIH